MNYSYHTTSKGQKYIQTQASSSACGYMVDFLCDYSVLISIKRAVRVTSFIPCRDVLHKIIASHSKYCKWHLNEEQIKSNIGLLPCPLVSLIWKKTKHIFFPSQATM